MAKYKDYSYEQGLLIPVSFDKQIIEGTIEHTICWLVDNKIDITIFDKKYRNDLTGAKAYHPGILLKIILLAYSRGIISSRKIMQLCSENIIFKAIAADTEPDFTTIAAFIRNMEDEILDVFRMILLVCSEMNLLGGTEFALDGCKISSNTSKEWSGTFSDLKLKKEKIDKTITYLIKKHASNDFEETFSTEHKNDYAKKIEKLNAKSEKIELFLSENKPKIKSRNREAQSNITDNESAKIKCSHGVIQGYNGMALVDSKYQVIFNAEAFGSGQEHDLLKPMIQKAKEISLSINLREDYFKDKIIIADTGSFEETNLEYLSSERIDAYIPDQQFRKRDPRFITSERHKPEKKGLFKKEDFTFDELSNTFTCPAGKTLKFSGYQKFNNTEGRKYISKRSQCGECEKRNDCLSSEKTRYRTLYVIEKYFNRNHSEEMKQKIDTEHGRDVYSKRMGIVEPVFGNIRANKGLDRFTLRTKDKVDIQWKLFCCIHNIEKISNYGTIQTK